MQVSTQPYKGARDFFPLDMRKREFMWETWKKVCKRYGYEQYDFPILEPFELFAAKTGEEIVNNQLFSFEDGSGRKLAMRPELTPSTVRMLASKYKELVKPVRWFMIGNNWRYEQPQRGRGREFYQLEVNIFGESSVNADFEIFSIIIDIMKQFGADDSMFELFYSDRRLIKALLIDLLGLEQEKAEATRRLMDKKAKMSQEKFNKALSELGLEQPEIDAINKFMNANLGEIQDIFPISITPEAEQAYKDLLKLENMLKEAGYDKYASFNPAIIRGFDYSDGLVYEVFDKNPENNRSMFGGERFDKLIKIFGDYDLEATGFAMGDVTLKNFLEDWNLMPEFDSEIDYFVTVWPIEENETETSGMTKYEVASQNAVCELRKKGFKVTQWLDSSTKIDKQLKYADRTGAKYVVLIGDNELDSNKVTIKNMKTGEQVEKELDLI